MDKLYYDKYDIMNMFHCGVDKAMAIIRSIKSVSDSLKIKGKVTTPDEVVKQIITLGLRCQFREIKNPTIKEMMEVQNG